MDTSCTKNWWNEEVNSVDIIEGFSMILTSGLIEFDHYGVPSISRGMREATIIIIIIIMICGSTPTRPAAAPAGIQTDVYIYNSSQSLALGLGIVRCLSQQTVQHRYIDSLVVQQSFAFNLLLHL